MAGRGGILTQAAGLATAAAVGGGVALGGAAAAGAFDVGTVRRLAADLPPAPASFAASARPLSPGEVYRRAAPGVVQVRRGAAAGSGFVLDKAGHVITTDAVVGAARSVRVAFSGNEGIEARVVGVDRVGGIAILQLAAGSRAFVPLALGDSAPLGVGDPVLAIGDPFGLARTATAGIVSALQHPAAAGGAAVDVLETDAALDRVGSGAPLLDAAGRVVGIAAPRGRLTGLAIPVDAVREAAARLLRGGATQGRAWLGIRTAPVAPALARLFHLPAPRGLLVEGVEPGSGAARAGLAAGTRPTVVAGESYVLGGDLLVRADGRAVATVADLRAAVARKRPGERVRLALYRGRRLLVLDVRLGRQPA